MSKIIRNVKKKMSRMERGQVLVVVAVAAIGIIAIIGLVMDVGLMFIGNARLRRAVDSAAIAAALQYRQGFDTPSLTNAADEFLNLNGFGFTNGQATVDDCATQPHDTTLCTTPPRKLVRVHATADVQLAFLPVIGIDHVSISATATSETASVDVVLVIDRSESMTYGDPSVGTHPVGDPMRDPYYCNRAVDNGLPHTDSNGHVHTSACQPFFTVVKSAINFTDILFFPYDQMAIVTFDKEAGVLNGEGKWVPNLEFNQDCPHGTENCTTNDAVIPALSNLTVYEGADSYSTPSKSPTEDYRCYGVTSNCTTVEQGNDICTAQPIYGTGTNYQGLIGRAEDPCDQPNGWQFDPTHYTTTNIGAGLEMAANELASDPRQDVLWVVILLTDGVPNAGHDDASTVFYCPTSTWTNRPPCNNKNAAGDWTTATRPLSTSPNYDALAYAFNEADYVGLPFNPATGGGGQDALIYTIGLGSELTNYQLSNFTYSGFNWSPPVTVYPPSAGLGTIFLNYAAAVGRGQYYPAPTSTQLDIIFRQIGSNIAVRLEK